MTNTMHRQGTVESLQQDYIIFSTTAAGFNRTGSEEAQKRFIEIMMKHRPVNMAAVMWCDWSGRDRGDPDWLGGLALLLGGVAFQLISAHFYLEWFERLALLPVLAGCVLLLKGRPTMRWSWPAIGFLFFMIPLPYTLEVALRGPLRRLGTLAGTYVMQTLGLPAFAEGNVINVGEVQIGVVEACSGLRMLMIFFALSTAVALLIQRPLCYRF